MSRSYPIMATRVRASIPHPFPASIHLLRSGAALAGVGAKKLGLLLRS